MELESQVLEQSDGGVTCGKADGGVAYAQDGSVTYARGVTYEGRWSYRVEADPLRVLEGNEQGDGAGGGPTTTG